MELSDFALYETCPILYQEKDSLPPLSVCDQTSSEKITELIRKTVMFCCRRMFSLGKRYDKKKVGKIWTSFFRDIYCPGLDAIPQELSAAYNQSLLVLHNLHPWLNFFENKIVGLNFPINALVYNKKLDVCIPLILAEDDGMSLVFFQNDVSSSPAGFFNSSAVRFSALVVAENVNKISKIRVLGATTVLRGTNSVPSLEAFEFAPSSNYWRLAYLDLASLMTAIDEKLFYPNLRHCANCVKRDDCDYSLLERNGKIVVPSLG